MNEPPMAKILPKVLDVAIALIVGASVLLGAVSAIFGSLKYWPRDNPIWAWLVITVLGLCTGTFYLLWRSAMKNLEREEGESAEKGREIERLGGDLAGNEGAMITLTREVEKLRRELTEEKSKTADLEARLSPSQRDRELFESILAALDWQHNPIAMLERFNGTWRRSEAEALFECSEVWRTSLVDDEHLRPAFDRLRDAVDDMTSWMVREADGVDELNRNLDSPLWLYRVPPPPSKVRTKSGSDSEEWQRYRQVIAEGEGLAREVLEARREFEKAGRARGL